MSQTFWPDAVAALPLRSGRAAPLGATAAWPCGALLRRPHEGKDVFKKDVKTSPASHTSCASLTWWLWRGGCTRSLSEHGRETPQRLWYFVLRRGRVGRCQVC